LVPEWRLLLAHAVGRRTRAMAKRLLSKIKARTDGRAPLFTSDRLRHYYHALLEHYGYWRKARRRRGRGRPRKTRRLPKPSLKYAQVIKHRRKGRIVRVTRTIILGKEEEVLKTIASSGCGRVVNTSYVERLKLTLRQGISRLVRRTQGFSKKADELEAHLTLFEAYYNFVKPHKELRLRAEITGAWPGRKWIKRTPAMAAGITDHVWTLEELLTYKISPINT